MRLARPLCLLLVAACGDAASMTDETTTSPGTTAPDPTIQLASEATTDVPTSSGSGSASATDSTTTVAPVTTSTTDPDTTTTSTTAPNDTLGTAPGDTSSGDTGTDESSTGGEACPCPDIEVPLDDGIFVVSDTNELWKYFPADNMFSSLGELGCDLPPGTWSMGVDRQGYAWVQYASGELRKVAVTDLSDCTDPGYVVGQQDILHFGMAFVSNSASDKCDRIYGSGSGSQISPFFDIDPVTLQLTKHGDGIPGGTSEVTGTGDGRAFLFTATAPPRLVEVDKLTGEVLSTTMLPQLTIGTGLAFAFFAGDFYFFTDGQEDFKSEVTHMDYDDSDNNGQQDIVQVYDDAPLRILGAGVSTCAPFLPQ